MAVSETLTGKYGVYGGQFVPETLMTALAELTDAWIVARADKGFLSELQREQADFIGRPTPLYLADRLTDHFGGARIYLKREDLCHTGAHKLNNALGQALLARRMGKKRIIAETGAGQHGVATATICARFDLECVVYMGTEDMARQAINVRRMRMLGAEVVPVEDGTRTLKDALSAAIRDWVASVANTYYIIGSVAGPHPYPALVKSFQRVIGDEARAQFLKREGRLPDAVVACVGGGSNAMGIFAGFLDDPEVHLVGVEAAGRGLETGLHAAAISGGRPGILHGSLSYVLQDDKGQIVNAHSVSAGLDYPGVGPEHAYLRDTERATYVVATDTEALAACRLCTRKEGILPALESAHALHYAGELARDLGPRARILVCLSGRGDKDLDTIENN